MNNMLRFFKMYEDVEDIVIGSSDSAGIDLKSYEDYIIEPNGILKIKTGLKFIFPNGTFGKIENRSSMSLKNIQVYGGIIDRDYTGEIIVILKNYNSFNFVIKKGDKIAQLICIKYEKPIIKEIYEIRETERGEKGFGSSGK